MLLLCVGHNRDRVIGGCWGLLKSSNYIFLLKCESLAGHVCVVVQNGNRGRYEWARALHGGFDKVVLQNFANLALLLLNCSSGVYITNEHIL